MLNNVLKQRKELFLFLLMFILFAYFAVIRVDHLENGYINHENIIEMVYNK